MNGHLFSMLITYFSNISSINLFLLWHQLIVRFLNNIYVTIEKCFCHEYKYCGIPINCLSCAAN